MGQLTHEQLLKIAGHPIEGDLRSAIYKRIETDSRKVDKETIFFALPGVASNGWDYLDQVAALGCRVAVVPDNLGLTHPDIYLLPAAKPTELLVACLHGFFGRMPEKIVAVTGTNGKSSICYYLAQLAEYVGLKSGLISTFGIGPLGCLKDAQQTTPDILSLHNTLMSLADENVNFVAFEASSHALDQGRIDGVPFQTAVFSNLSHDHLDYHGDMSSYAEAKRRLFTFPGIKYSIFCLDDEFTSFMTAAAISTDCYFYSEQNPSADFYVKDLVFQPSGCQFVLCHPEGVLDVFLPLLGRFNIQNALAALSSLWYQVEDRSRLLEGLSYLQGAPGRMDKVQVPDAPIVVVDYAHTPDALKVALQALKEHSQGRLICVFGCGGDRDKTKRPLMMEAVMNHADAIWLTSDNPRTESVEQIIADTLSSVDRSALVQKGGLYVEADRRLAIQAAISSASIDDVILIAGKGHETYQDIQGVKHHFDDREEAREGLKKYVN
ncbi:UDP-N-acetylmuramoyl-L-alanyl-D-glutamate--2,6-diaminopimelate ligase [Marinomonas transparens]|uniref:UDP-N-acetylmuramoyl-L-alanyl-D-glutamate--2,6-diaminopimelate ligase n=1 Tax=Marinomonas transparens TaxID=2795388 RepID=A0A934JSJ3_9GAMM|nr:UDP-N-acetylmuramoyl-L-alanyl-D-glutamate--2,6-diaminopimelate ligase [Marinomonas transparens]MBJ7537557.1 UDP-N-acetylmuramoyl-L-alanyl-D-glutamate--2,6-diaminopimelate ligase [Marinomonas transparens]